MPKKTGKKKSVRAAGINKKDLTEQLALRAGIPKTKAANYINLLTGLISDSLVSGKKVTISDFGTFNLSTRQSFKGFNPQNNEHIHVPQRIIPVFRAGKLLKNSLNLPFIKHCALSSGKKLNVTFSKTIVADNKDLLKKTKYNVFLNGKKQTITSVHIDKKNKEGIESVELRTKTKLLEGDLSVSFHGILSDNTGNASEEDLFWPRD